MSMVPSGINFIGYHSLFQLKLSIFVERKAGTKAFILLFNKTDHFFLCPLY